MNEHDRVKVCEVAVGLLSDDDDNAEYDRAIVEMTTELLGLSTNHKESVGMVLRSIKEGSQRMNEPKDKSEPKDRAFHYGAASACLDQAAEAVDQETAGYLVDRATAHAILANTHPQVAAEALARWERGLDE